MLERIKILTLLQLSNKSRLYVKGSKRIYTHIAIRTAIIIALTVVVSLVLHALKNILYIPVNEFLMIFILLLTQGLNIGVSTIGLVNDLYHSKDNQILFSLAAKNDEIFLSKILVYYINEFVRNLFVLIPLFVGFGVISSLGFLYYFSLIFILFFLPIISVGVSSFISMPLASFLNYIKRNNFLSALLSLVFVMIAFYLTYLLVSQIETPIRIVQLYNRFVLGLTLAIQRVAAYGTIYAVIGKMLFGYSYLLNLLILLMTVIILIALNYLVSKPVYFKLMSSSQENTIKKKKKSVTIEAKTLFITFLKKEFTIARRSLNELLSNYALLLTLPFFMYVLNYIYMGMNRSSFGNQVVLILNVFITLLIATGSNTASAVAITTEGYEFVLLKTAPYNTSRMAWAKITFNFFATTLMIALSFLLFSRALPVFPRKDIWLLFIFIVLVNSGHILKSFQIDLLSPKLSDYAATGSITNNNNVAKSLSYGLFLSFAFLILAIIAFIFAKDIGWYLMIGLALFFLIFRFYWFNIYLKAYFDEIEY
jgi:ABC-2 type transport system permease protein